MDNKDTPPELSISRRWIIKLGLLTAATCLIPYKALASVADVFSSKRTLSFHNLHTEEKLDAVYWQDGEYLPEGLSRINVLLRDHYAEKVETIDEKLLDLLFSIQASLKSTEPFQIISGYRAPETNSFLRKLGRGVAKNSMHMLGKAVDFRIPGFDLTDVWNAASELQAGGVGYYAKSNFVHVDVGEVRYW
jgi:uncharacterized protein YcbK (DUF882 family)